MKFRESRDLISAARTDGIAEAMDVHRVQHSLEPSRISFRRGGPSPQTRSRQSCALRNTSVFCGRPGRRRPRDANPQRYL